MLLALGVHAHYADHDVIAEHHAVDVVTTNFSSPKRGLSRVSTSASEASMICRLTLDLELGPCRPSPESRSGIGYGRLLPYRHTAAGIRRLNNDEHQPTFTLGRSTPVSQVCLHLHCPTAAGSRECTETLEASFGIQLF